jgi:Fe-coproporphyrin III synthase
MSWSLQTNEPLVSSQSSYPSPRVMRSPRSLDIEITSACNLKCRYCYFFNNPAVNYQDLPTREWLRFFDELGTHGIMNVTLAGGEPFCRKDLPQLIESIVSNRMRFSLLSNGALIDDKTADFLARTGRCDQIQISLDGSNPKSHDACRGEGSFAEAVRGIRILQHYDLPVSVRVTIHRHNVHELESTADFLLNTLGLPGFSTNAAGYLGSCRLEAAEILLSLPERELAIKTLLALSRQYEGRIAASAGPLADGKVWKKMEEARQKKAPAFSRGGRLTACGCPGSKMAVRADGIFIPCSLLAHLELGRINRDSLLEVWQNHPIMDQMRRRSEIPLSHFEFCLGCLYQPYCTGNCPGLAYTLTGQVNHPSPEACLRNYLDGGGSLA